MARCGAAPLTALSLSLLLPSCDAFYALGPNGCDAEHPCQGAERPRCDLMTRRCQPPERPAPLGDGPPCRDHGDCPSGVCDELGLVTSMPGRCLQPGAVMPVRTAEELQEALDQYAGVRVASGTYVGDWWIKLRSVIVVGPQARSAGAEPAQLRPPHESLDRDGGVVIRISDGGRAMLDGLLVRGGVRPSGSGIYCETADSRVALRRSEVSENFGRAIWARCPVWVTQSRIGGWEERWRNQGGGLRAEDAATVTNTFIVHNGTAFSSLGGLQLAGDPRSSRLLAHLTFVGNLAGVNGVAADCGRAMVPIWRSLLWDNQLMPGHHLLGGSCLLYAAALDDIENTWAESVQLGNDNPPRFRSEFDFHLLPGSPAEDSVPSSDQGPRLPVDYDGDRRPLGKGYDYGADEVGL